MFRRRKKGEQSELPTSMLWPLAAWFQRQLMRVAQWLQQLAGRLSFSTRCWLLALFCLLFTGASIAVALSGLQGDRKALKITPIRAVAPAAIQRLRPVISRGEYLRFQALQRYLDSLQTQEKGALDRLLRQHPHLTDTLRWLQSLYLHQQKQETYEH